MTRKEAFHAVRDAQSHHKGEVQMLLGGAKDIVTALGGTLRYDRDLGEYSVTFRHTGPYYTTDIDDAVNTAHCIAAELAR